MLHETIHTIVGNDILEIYGPTGSGKTLLAMTIAASAATHGKKVLIIDTEKNTHPDIISGAQLVAAYLEQLENVEIKYITDIDQIITLLTQIGTKTKPELVVIDSIGYPVLTKFAEMNLQEKGRALLKIINASGILKTKCLLYQFPAVITNQPESMLGKTSEEDLMPFGDKHIYAAKELWRSFLANTTETETTIHIRAWRSRIFPRKQLLYEIRIKPDQVKITQQFNLRKLTIAGREKWLVQPEKHTYTFKLEENKIALTEEEKK